MALQQNTDFPTFKLLLIGDSGSGKSSIMLRFTDEVWIEPEDARATIGVDFKVKVVDVDGKRYKLTIWDTAGQERYRTLTSSYYRGAQGVILVYDITNRASFEHLNDWFSELETYTSSPNVVTLVVGNKLDRANVYSSPSTTSSDEQDSSGRAVTRKEGEAYASKMGALFVEASARTRQGVREAFEEVVRKVGVAVVVLSLIWTPYMRYAKSLARPTPKLSSLRYGTPLVFASVSPQIIETPDLWQKRAPSGTRPVVITEQPLDETGSCPYQYRTSPKGLTGSTSFVQRGSTHSRNHADRVAVTTRAMSRHAVFVGKLNVVRPEPLGGNIPSIKTQTPAGLVANQTQTAHSVTASSPTESDSARSAPAAPVDSAFSGSSGTSTAAIERRQSLPAEVTTSKKIMEPFYSGDQFLNGGQPGNTEAVGLLGPSFRNPIGLRGDSDDKPEGISNRATYPRSFMESVSSDVMGGVTGLTIGNVVVPEGCQNETLRTTKTKPAQWKGRMHKGGPQDRPETDGEYKNYKMGLSTLGTCFNVALTPELHLRGIELREDDRTSVANRIVAHHLGLPLAPPGLSGNATYPSTPVARRGYIENFPPLAGGKGVKEKDVDMLNPVVRAGATVQFEIPARRTMSLPVPETVIRHPPTPPSSAPPGSASDLDLADLFAEVVPYTSSDPPLLPRSPSSQSRFPPHPKGLHPLLARKRPEHTGSFYSNLALPPPLNKPKPSVAVSTAGVRVVAFGDPASSRDDYEDLRALGIEIEDSSPPVSLSVRQNDKERERSSRAIGESRQRNDRTKYGPPPDENLEEDVIERTGTWHGANTSGARGVEYWRTTRGN
ncbi:hypothetical protein HDU93_008901 [Gonapodya sp. JEL0774]|nr:hypothetical protein HDU93_008901 [Gonapodya sp. JEL0774]